jgi:hypothetical protein
MRTLRLDYSKFISEYKDALTCGLHFKEFLELTGISPYMLNDRLKTLAQRGLVLPKLKGMRNRRSGIVPAKRKVKRRAKITRPSAQPTARRSEPAAAPAASPTFVICVGG